MYWFKDIHLSTVATTLRIQQFYYYGDKKYTCSRNTDQI